MTVRDEELTEGETLVAIAVIQLLKRLDTAREQSRVLSYLAVTSKLDNIEHVLLEDLSYLRN